MRRRRRGEGFIFLSARIIAAPFPRKTSQSCPRRVRNSDSKQQAALNADDGANEKRPRFAARHRKELKIIPGKVL